MTSPIPVIGVGAAFSAWLSILIVLSTNSNSIVSGFIFVLLTTLAFTHRKFSLIWVSLVVGFGMLVIVPSVAYVDGSLELLISRVEVPDTALGWVDAAARSLRIPAQVMSAVLLLLVPARLLFTDIARVSPQAALMGAVAARMRPLLAQDLRMASQSLESRGYLLSSRGPLRERVRASISLWDVMVTGLLDRAFITSAALETRGWGRAKPTADAMDIVELSDGFTHDNRIDRSVVILAGLALIANAVGRNYLLCAVFICMFCFIQMGRRRSKASAWHDPEPPILEGSLLANRPSNLLSLVGVSMSYPGSDSLALRDVDLNVLPGELVVLVGSSGSGKSTLLDVISGVAPAVTGGRRDGIVRLGDVVREGFKSTPGEPQVAALFQQPESQIIVGHVAEEVAFGLRHMGVGIDEIEQRVLDSLTKLGIRHLASRNCATLSGGELQRVLLAAALVMEPSVLVLDEPTSQVDARTEGRFWDIIDELRMSRRIGVVVAEHRISHLVGRADRFVWLKDGTMMTSSSLESERFDLSHLTRNPFQGLFPAMPVDSGRPRLGVLVDRLCAGGDGKRTLFRGLSFAAPAGAVITLEGQNGTGKSTLLRAIRGLTPGGVISVDGQVLDSVQESVHRMAWLSQNAAVQVCGRTVLSVALEMNVKLGLEAGRTIETLTSAGLASKLEVHPNDLSVGQRQRLALIALTAHRPAVWLLDEPTRGMDADSRRWVASYVLAHAREGGVVLVATHDSQLAAAIATHRLRLDLRTGPSILPVHRDKQGNVVEDVLSKADSQQLAFEADR